MECEAAPCARLGGMGFPQFPWGEKPAAGVWVGICPPPAAKPRRSGTNNFAFAGRGAKTGLMKTIATVLPALLSLAISCSAADDKLETKHPIDVKVEKAADDANSTAESAEAYRNGLELWDKEMNRVYQELKKVLPEKSFAALKASQVQWLAFRDAQIAFIDSCYDQYSGTMHIPGRAAATMEVTRVRTLDLSHRLGVHKEFAE
jgi:uncharacterized protein YecT (DUF1311 family)